MWKLLTALLSLGFCSVCFSRWANTSNIFFSQKPKVITLIPFLSVYTSTTVLVTDVCDLPCCIRKPSCHRSADIIKIFPYCYTSHRIPFKGKLYWAHCRMGPQNASFPHSIFCENTAFELGHWNFCRFLAHRRYRGCAESTRGLGVTVFLLPSSAVWGYLATRWCNEIKIRASNATA